MTSPLPADAGLLLLPLARRAIARHLDAVPLPTQENAALPGTSKGAEDPSWLRAPGASFVTLTSGRAPGGSLRGCIGSLEAHEPLRADVESNAVAAAVGDPRFPPLTAGELADTVIEVSVLSASVPLPAVDESDLAARLRPGVDGVILSTPRHRATFLPQVWSDLPDPARFLELLRRKAGLPPGYWGPDVVVETYTVTAWKEAAPGTSTPRPGPGGQPGTSVDGAP